MADITEIRITDTDDGQEFIVFSAGSTGEIVALLDVLNSCEELVAGVVE